MRSIKFWRFAKGMKCPNCSAYMWAEKEDEQPKGSWVYYLCRNMTCNNRVKIFESK